MNYKRLITVGLLIGAIAGLSGFITLADDPVSRIIAMLNTWSSRYPQEKVYLHLDKPYYAIGDDVWFKAYVTAGGDHRLSAISGVLNVDLVNDRDSVKRSLKLPVYGGLTWGDINLPDTLKEGNYHLRAYTNWMRNNADYIFDVPVTIVNAITNNVFTNTTYSYSTKNAKPQVTAAISYTDLQGTPYAGLPVSYQLALNDKITLKGKGQTDAKGTLSVTLTDPSTGVNNNPTLLTYLRISAGKTVEKHVPVKAASNVNVQFFPEGGNLVNGNESRVAFKAIGSDGLGAAVKGVITDEQNKQMAVFESAHLGMGAFNFTPRNGRSYKAKITFADGSVQDAVFPGATNAGYTLSINNEDDKDIKIDIKPGSTVETSTEQTGTMSLIGQSGGVVYYAGKSNPGSKSFTAVVSKDKFPTGIVQFTLFNASGEPLNERLVFVQKHDQLKVAVSTDKQNYSARAKVKVSIKAADKNDQPVKGSFSVSVTDESKVPDDETARGSILSNLLLTSDIKGYVEQPGYYFDNENSKIRGHLDVLMLTQGYRRFEWKQVLSGSYPDVKYAAERSLQISGQLKTMGGKPVANGKVTLFTSKGGFFMVDTVTDSEGHFVFKNLIFRDSVKFLLQGRTAKDHKNVKIDIDEYHAQPAPYGEAFTAQPANVSSRLFPFLINSKTNYDEQLRYGLINRAITLKEVVVKDKRIDVVKSSSNLNGPGNADQVLTAAQFTAQGCSTIADCLQGRLLGVVIRNDTPYLARNLRNPMQIVIDGVFVNVDVLNTINPADIGSVEVLRTISYTSIYGGRGGYGLLVITTKRGNADYNVQRYSPGVITYMPKGYSKVREFYSPQYDNPKTNAKVPDLRSTIYWKPNIISGKDGTASFEYFNADGKGTYKMVIEGIDVDGNLARQVYRYKVE